MLLCPLDLTTVMHFIHRHNINKIQIIQTAADRLLTDSKISDQMKSAFTALHFLPVSLRNDFTAHF